MFSKLMAFISFFSRHECTCLLDVKFSFCITCLGEAVKKLVFSYTVLAGFSIVGTGTSRTVLLPLSLYLFEENFQLACFI
jgi:multidrug transporter EmrE-like cation transporter